MSKMTTDQKTEPKKTTEMAEEDLGKVSGGAFDTYIEIKGVEGEPVSENTARRRPSTK